MDDEHEWYDAGEQDDETEEIDDGDTVIKCARIDGEDYIHIDVVTKLVELAYDMCVDALVDTVISAVVDAGKDTKRRVATLMKAFRQRVEDAGSVEDAGNPEEQG